MSHLLVVEDSLVDSRLVGGLLGAKYSVEYSSNGLDALESMEARLPLAVVTDLRMPEMDGMQLVKAVRQRFPMVPVILMTAHGSEEIAMRALMAGAADYIPKSKLCVELLKSVEGILAFASGGFGWQRLARCLRHEELEYELENDPLLIPPLGAASETGGPGTGRRRRHRRRAAGQRPGRGPAQRDVPRQP